jgi:NAD(P)-dependent dehydrogenase (short-subunit alcohol dehydrogenase family)
MKLDNAVVLITGGASGLGWACAQEVLDLGGRVSVVDLKEPPVPRGDSGVLFIPGDITKPEVRQMAVDRTVDRFGRIDVLINNAGVGLYAYAEEACLHASRRMFEVNVFAPLAMAQLVAPRKSRAALGFDVLCLEIRPPLRQRITATGTRRFWSFRSDCYPRGGGNAISAERIRGSSAGTRRFDQGDGSFPAGESHLPEAKKRRQPVV